MKSIDFTYAYDGYNREHFQNRLNKKKLVKILCSNKKWIAYHINKYLSQAIL